MSEKYRKEDRFIHYSNLKGKICCRCLRNEDACIDAKFFRYGVPLCSEECATAVSDNTISDYLDDIPQYHRSIDAIKNALAWLPTEKMNYRYEGNFWSVLAKVTGAEDAECLDKAIQRVVMASPEQYAKAYILMIKPDYYETEGQNTQ